MKDIIFAGLLLGLWACNRSDPQPLGTVQDCDNGSYFSLKEQSCQQLWGYKAARDSEGFDRLQIINGITVPRKINGQSNFAVEIAYDITRQSTLEVVMKRVDFGQMSNDSFTHYQKLVVEPGQGSRTLILKPNQKIPPGPAAAYLDGRWSRDSGYAIEVKGGDRFEDEDDDQLKAWRVAGIQVDENAPDDPVGKDIVLGELLAPNEVHGCELVRVTLPVHRLRKSVSFDLALKRPGTPNWDAYGGQTIAIEAGFEGILNFDFLTQNKDGTCAPTGPAAIPVEGTRNAPDAYLFQLDVFDSSGKKLDLMDRAYIVPSGSLPVLVSNIDQTGN
jgi:hypothetical protein